GGKGTSNHYLLHFPDGRTQKVGSKDMIFQVPKGTWLEMYCGGGGGYGSPIQRDIENVEEEVLAGMLSIEKAKSEYGVEFDQATGKVNFEATNQLRKQLLP
ncbi:MAG: hydantoinase B/oxoprolinase family protein, partial [Bacillota bacterium]|nr:hydantoinase B/oxoprolinase family protein [Bacillota bacterium]